MLVINEDLVKIPEEDFPKMKIENPWETDNLIDKTQTGIVDNHPKWVINKEKGQKILDIYDLKFFTIYLGA